MISLAKCLQKVKVACSGICILENQTSTTKQSRVFRRKRIRKGRLVVVVTVCGVIIHSPNIHYNVQLLEHIFISSPNNFYKDPVKVQVDR